MPDIPRSERDSIIASVVGSPQFNAKGQSINFDARSSACLVKCASSNILEICPVRGAVARRPGEGGGLGWGHGPNWATTESFWKRFFCAKRATGDWGSRDMYLRAPPPPLSPQLLTEQFSSRSDCLSCGRSLWLLVAESATNVSDPDASAFVDWSGAGECSSWVGTDTFSSCPPPPPPYRKPVQPPVDLNPPYSDMQARGFGRQNTARRG